MARSVVLKGTVRCVRCQIAPRWCVCDGIEWIETPVAVEVLMHKNEAMRPTSTGHLISRVVAGARRHLFTPGEPMERAEIAREPENGRAADAEREIWVLHPNGEPPPREVRPETLQVVLIDGSWKQAGGMLRVAERWGRRVRLPLSGESRYWLRSQQEGGRFSTAEALAGVFGALGMREAEERLRLQLELHVYATLCARGRNPVAAEFLKNSPLRDAMPEVVRRIAVGR